MKKNGIDQPAGGPRYWRSLDQVTNRPEFRQWLEREFPEGASEWTDPVSRRHFAKIMSASFMLAGIGLTGCRRPEEHIVPFSKKPEGYTHGVAQYFATAMPNRHAAVPLLVKSHEGRPVKIEGNPDHPAAAGGTDSFTQASILNLYDPDRATDFIVGQNPVTEKEALAKLAEVSKSFRNTRGQGLAILAEPSSSTSRARLVKKLRESLPKALFFEYDALDLDAGRRAASHAYKQDVRLAYKLDKASVILSLDSDFIGTEAAAHESIHAFTKGRRVRKPGDEMNRLYSVEALHSLTGAKADHRLAVPSTSIQHVALELAAAVLQHGKIADSEAKRFLAQFNLTDEAPLTDFQKKWIEECAKDLVAHAGSAVVMAGHRQPMPVHLVALALNEVLGGRNKTFTLLPAEQDHDGGIKDLVSLLNSHEVETLVLMGGNPAYDAPVDLKWDKAVAKAKQIIRFGYYPDESSTGAHIQVPALHFLESWGDARTADGTLVPIQPLVRPLFGGLSDIEFLARLIGMELTGHALVKETFSGIQDGSENTWRKFLHDGLLKGSAFKPVPAKFQWASSSQVIHSPVPPKLSEGNLEVVFHRDYSVDDGRYNNNGWLQETPDPITKLTWDNAVLMSPQTAHVLGLDGIEKAHKGRFNCPVVKVELDGRVLEGPAWIVPGMADYTLGLALGYGRPSAGRVGRLDDGKPSGFNAFEIRSSDGLHHNIGVKVERTARVYPLASTQEHWAIEGRPAVREANRDQFIEHPDFVDLLDLDGKSHTAHLDMVQGTQLPKKIYEPPKLNGMHQWGMSIDLGACVGCSACAVACQSENNIPIVGKEQVIRGREMSWLRLDRYFAGDVKNPQTVFQPMICQHCEHAPCESVCPVNATVHDEEGLNVMAYNRCVGTRYCSNNCPYKVRRFNYFDYNRRSIGKNLYESPLVKPAELSAWWENPDRGDRPDDEWDLLKLISNPDVTVRMRGVMEKCTFCVQRIEQGKISRKVLAGGSGDVRVPDGTIKTACQQACPADAIVFGDTADPDSEVSQLKRLVHDYSVLGYLDTRPRTTYLAGIRNPNSAMPDYHESPLSLQDYADTHGDPFNPHGHGEHGHDDSHGHGEETHHAPAGTEHNSEKGNH